MGETGSLEVLDGPGREPRSRRIKVVLVVLLAVLVTVALTVDLRLRSSEGRAVAACAARARESIRLADSHGAAMMNYVRPVLDSGAPPHLRRQMFRMISQASAGSDRRLAGPRRECGAVRVLPLHGALRDRRDACLRVLDRHAAFLRRVAADGRAVASWPDGSTAC